MYARILEGGHEPSDIEIAEAVKKYEEDLARVRRDVHDVLSHLGPPTMSLEELQALLDKELGDVSLSRLVREMQEEGDS